MNISVAEIKLDFSLENLTMNNDNNRVLVDFCSVLWESYRSSRYILAIKFG